MLAPGTPLTAETLAGLMMQISDNTATDMLIRVLGRPAIEALTPRNRPLLTTGELFRLAAADDLRERYARGDATARRALLAGLADLPLPDARALARRATWQQAEWFLTAREICGLLAGLRDAPALNGTPNPLVATDGWRRVAFKGGSEFGVLNFSAIGTTPEGREVCAVITANGDRAQPEDRLALLYAALFRGLGAGR